MKKSILKWIVFIAIGVILAIAITLIVTAESRADAFLREMIDEKLGDDFQLTYESSAWGIFERSVSLNEIAFSKTHDDTLLWKSNISGIDLYGFGVYDLLVRKKYTVDSLSIKSPHIQLFDFSSHPDTLRKKEERELKKVAIEFGIQKFELINGNFTYDPEGPEHLSAKYSSRVVDVQIDGADAPINRYVRNAEFVISDLTYITQDSLYTLKFEELATRIGEKKLHLLNLDYRANVDIAKYSEKFGWRKAMIQATLDTVILDISELDKVNHFKIPSIEIGGLHLTIDQDLNFQLKNRVTKLPQEMAEDVKILFEIDSITVHSGQLEHYALLENGNRTKTKLEQMNAVLSGVQNIDKSLPLFTLTSSGTLYSASQLFFNAVYRYGDVAPFEYNGYLTNTKLTALDNFLYESAGIEIVSGSLDKLEFSATGNKYATSGYVDFNYQDLEIKAINQETGKEKFALNALADVLGGLVFWKSNPAHNNQRRGHFEVERDVRKGFVSQWVDGILEGIIATVAKVDPLKIQERADKKKKSRKRK